MAMMQSIPPSAETPGADPAEIGEAVLIEIINDQIMVITLNRPRARNAIDSAMSIGLHRALRTLDDRNDLRVGILNGAGGTFCAGMDLKAFARVGKPRGVRELLRTGTKKPLLAAIEGVALGGGLELALMADLIVAASGAQMGLPEARVGLFPSGGALQRLQGMVPRSIISEMAFTGDRMNAERAYQVGLVSRLTAPGEALPEAVSLATRVTNCAPLGVLAAKELLTELPQPGITEFWRRQGELADAVACSDDAREGALAFTEKRKPLWRNT